MLGLVQLGPYCPYTIIIHQQRSLKVLEDLLLLQYITMDHKLLSQGKGRLYLAHLLPQLLTALDAHLGPPVAPVDIPGGCLYCEVLPVWRNTTALQVDGIQRVVNCGSASIHPT